MKPEDVINEVRIKWMEYLEMADDPSAMLERLLASMVIQERKKSEYNDKVLRTQARISNYDF